MSNESILVIDDEDQIRKLLSISLQASSYRVFEARTWDEGLSRVASDRPDLVLLDLGLPGTSGHDVLKHLRDWYTNPLIIISVQNNEENITKALDNGANDYVTRPFRTNEWLTRIRSHLQKATCESNAPMLTYENISVDFANREIYKNGNLVKLTVTEYSLLTLLVRNEGKVLTHQYLLSQVWGPSHQGESQYLRILVSQIRNKIEADPNRPAYIMTEPGVGYRFIGKRVSKLK